MWTEGFLREIESAWLSSKREFWCAERGLWWIGPVQVTSCLVYVADWIGLMILLRVRVLVWDFLVAEIVREEE